MRFSSSMQRVSHQFLAVQGFLFVESLPTSVDMPNTAWLVAYKEKVKGNAPTMGFQYQKCYKNEALCLFGD